MSFITPVSADTAIWAAHYNQLVNALNQALANRNYATIAELEGKNMSAVTYTTFALVHNEGLFRWMYGSTEYADGSDVLTNPSGRWKREGGGSGSALEDAMFDYLADAIGDIPSSLRTTLSTLQTQVSRITTTLVATATLDFASMATQTSASLTVAVPGAAINDIVSLGLPASLNDGLIPTAWVSAADTVTIRLRNTTAGTIDPASDTYRIEVRKH